MKILHIGVTKISYSSNTQKNPGFFWEICDFPWKKSQSQEFGISAMLPSEFFGRRNINPRDLGIGIQKIPSQSHLTRNLRHKINDC